MGNKKTSGGDNYNMEENKELVVNKEKTGMGTIRISEEVVKIIAGLATTEIPGVAGMSGGIVGGIAERLGRKNFSKGIKAEVGEKEAALDLSIIVDYGIPIYEIATKIQHNVKNTIEKMTGLKVVEVNVSIQGVAFGQEGKEDIVQ